MTNKYKQELREAGVDVESALDRFMGSESMYDKFLLKFVQEHTFRQLQESLLDKDIRNAFLLAHTMKGICANLELHPLLDILAPMTEQLRSGNMKNVTEQLELLNRLYQNVCDIIRENHSYQ